ncbi:hypothetical protein KFE25_000639 [Diacronema lutheri]|uniref:Methyltransferase FkbM domain-containing protein n=1 Tax=Diacronema lutheri TaxID=2081491 RepID=A0A8J5XLY4_DIALT|nr:hypothetical protein KFE25_000639 [Diacronema lutheri]
MHPLGRLIVCTLTCWAAAYPSEALQTAGRVSASVEVLRAALFRVCELHVDMRHVGGGSIYRPFVVPSNDEFVGHDICTSHNFDRAVVETMRPYIAPGSTVIDAGGNLGAYAVQFSHWTGSRGRVLAFEPQPMIFKVLFANAMGGGLRNIDAFNVALGFKDGFVRMGATIPDGASQGRRFADALADPSAHVNFGGRSLGVGGELVRMITLDSLNVTGVSFIKIDVQGAESLVLHGARRTVLRELPTIIMESTASFQAAMRSPELAREMGIPPDVAAFDGHAWLENIGYRPVRRMGDDVFLQHPAQRLSATWPGASRPPAHFGPRPVHDGLEAARQRPWDPPRIGAARAAGALAYAPGESGVASAGEDTDAWGRDRR